MINMYEVKRDIHEDVLVIQEQIDNTTKKLHNLIEKHRTNINREAARVLNSLETSLEKLDNVFVELRKVERLTRQI